jgi:hypothetical protein
LNHDGFGLLRHLRGRLLVRFLEEQRN